MIVRLLGDKQYDVHDETMGKLERLEGELDAAVESGDDAAFSAALSSIIETVRSEGAPVDADQFLPSDLTVPHEGSTISDLRELLSSEPDTDTISEGA